MSEEEKLFNKLDILLKLVPDNLKANELIEKQCPFCNSKVRVSRASNNHLWIACEKEGVLLCQ